MQLHFNPGSTTNLISELGEREYPRRQGFICKTEMSKCPSPGAVSGEMRRECLKPLAQMGTSEVGLIARGQRGAWFVWDVGCSQ